MPGLKNMSLAALVNSLKFWVMWGLLFVRRMFMIGGFFGLMTFPVSYDWAALFVRVAVGAALLPYGLKKISDLQTFRGGKEPPEIFKFWFLSARAGFKWVMVIETATPVCLLLGFFTRLMTIPCMFSMSIAFLATKGKYFTSPASVYLLMMFAIFCIGAGQYSLDYYLMQVLSR